MTTVIYFYGFCLAYRLWLLGWFLVCFIFFYYVQVCMYLHAFIYTCVCKCPEVRSVRSLKTGTIGGCNLLIWRLGMKSESSARTVQILKLWAISSALAGSKKWSIFTAIKTTHSHQKLYLSNSINSVFQLSFSVLIVKISE